MRFSDQSIRLSIQEIVSNRTNSFKAYLEDIDITFALETQKLENVSIRSQANEQFIKAVKKLKLTFNVFSEDRTEAMLNFKKLESLINITRPVLENREKVSDANIINDSSQISSINATGNAIIKFDGFPALAYGLSSDEYRILVTSFSYGINKDMGYIQVPYKISELGENADKKYNDDVLVIPGAMKLIPIGFKVSIEGTIIIPPEKAYQIVTSETNFSKAALANIKKSYDPSTGASGGATGAGAQTPDDKGKPSEKKPDKSSEGQKPQKSSSGRVRPARTFKEVILPVSAESADKLSKVVLALTQKELYTNPPRDKAIIKELQQRWVTQVGGLRDGYTTEKIFNLDGTLVVKPSLTAAAGTIKRVLNKVSGEGAIKNVGDEAVVTKAGDISLKAGDLFVATETTETIAVRYEITVKEVYKFDGSKNSWPDQAPAYIAWTEFTNLVREKIK